MEPLDGEFVPNDEVDEMRWVTRARPRRLLSYDHDRGLLREVDRMNRDRFPGLRDGWARLDGPAGTQMVDTAIEAMAEFMRSGRNANDGGAFAAARRDRRAGRERARASVGALLGGDPRGVAFGPSMTAMTMRFSAAVGRTLQPGDEIVCTRLDHDANVRPVADRRRARRARRVRFAEPEPDTLELPASAVEAGALRPHALGRGHRRVQRGRHGARPARASSPPPTRAGARVYVDAVHAAPHRRSTSRRSARRARLLGLQVVRPARRASCARAPELLAELGPDKLRPSPDKVPDRWELGTLPFESLAGVTRRGRLRAVRRLGRRPRARGRAAGAALDGARRDRPA